MTTDRDSRHGDEATVEVHVIEQSADVLIAEDAARRLSGIAGFGDRERAEIGLAVRELAANVVKYARRGQARITAVPAIVEVEVSDHGPGIRDIGQALADGFSTGGSLGYGLGTANRLMDELDIASSPVTGTTVRALRRLHPMEPTADPCPLDAGAATVPKTGYDVNGDGFVITTWDAHLLVGVIDGVGHGESAHHAANAARRYVESHRDLPLESLFRGTGQACRGTRGVVMALARFDWAAGTLDLASVGNIEARTIGCQPRPGFVVRRGILGVNAPDARVTRHEWPVTAWLVLHSDGVVSRWDSDTVQDLLGAPAGVVATQLLGRLNRGTDDATVLVVRDRIR